MPSWGQVLQELQSAPGALDQVRRKYLQSLCAKTGRNVIAYYSGWLPEKSFQCRIALEIDLDELAPGASGQITDQPSLSHLPGPTQNKRVVGTAGQPGVES